MSRTQSRFSLKVTNQPLKVKGKNFICIAHLHYISISNVSNHPIFGHFMPHHQNNYSFKLCNYFYLTATKKAGYCHMFWNNCELNYAGDGFTLKYILYDLMIIYSTVFECAPGLFLTILPGTSHNTWYRCNPSADGYKHVHT